MIRPAHFGSNAETAGSNFFQRSAAGIADAALRAQREFDALALALADAGVRVHQFAGQRGAALPDEVFPNNWLSLHADGTAVLYPMLAAEPPPRAAARRARGARRLVRLPHRPRRRSHERSKPRGEYLEGTGSLVLDRERRVAYACRSPRTHAERLREFARALALRDRAVRGRRRRRARRSITPTSCCRSARASPRCARARSPTPRSAARSSRGSRRSGRELIDLTVEELESFAGNLLELAGSAGPVIALSAAALQLAGRADAARARALRRARDGGHRNDRAHRRRQRALHARRGGVAAAS